MADETAVSSETLARIVVACDRLLADEDWLADRPYEWRLELEALRERMLERLEDDLAYE